MVGLNRTEEDGNKVVNLKSNYEKEEVTEDKANYMENTEEKGSTVYVDKEQAVGVGKRMKYG